MKNYRQYLGRLRIGYVLFRALSAYYPLLELLLLWVCMPISSFHFYIDATHFLHA